MKNIHIGIIAVLMILLVGVYLENRGESKVLGSAIDGQEYFATTTDPGWGSAVKLNRVLKAGSGTFGSIAITLPAASELFIYDATTTSNGAIYGTTTLMHIGPSLAADTYFCDCSAKYGILAEIKTPTNIASSTITWK